MNDYFKTLNLTTAFCMFPLLAYAMQEITASQRVEQSQTINNFIWLEVPETHDSKGQHDEVLIKIHPPDIVPTIDPATGDCNFDYVDPSQNGPNAKIPHQGLFLWERDFNDLTTGPNTHIVSNKSKKLSGKRSTFALNSKNNTYVGYYKNKWNYKSTPLNQAKFLQEKHASRSWWGIRPSAHKPQQKQPEKDVSAFTTALTDLKNLLKDLKKSMTSLKATLESFRTKLEGL